MAIDGVKIIDSDQRYDIYNEVVDRYRDGEQVANIIKDILDEEKDYCQTDFFQKFIGLLLPTRCGRSVT